MEGILRAGVWPVMLTPFTEDGELDLDSVPRLVDWYLGHGCVGLFALCQSSEMFFLDLEEKRRLLEAVVAAVDGRVQVVASGHTSAGHRAQVEELRAMAHGGADAVVLVPNRLAAPDESDAVFRDRLRRILDDLDISVPLGWYECPYPDKRLLTAEDLDASVDSGRFGFVKDTCCDSALIGQRLTQLDGSGIQLYNANTTTLLESLRAGASGYSGVMANFHPELYVWLCQHWRDDADRARHVQAVLTACSWIELKNYPSSAKHHLVDLGILTSARTRTPSRLRWDATQDSEVQQVRDITAQMVADLG